MKTLLPFITLALTLAAALPAKAQPHTYGPLVVRNDTGHPVTFWTRMLHTPAGERFIMNDKIFKTTLLPGEEKQVELTWPNRKPGDSPTARRVHYEYEAAGKRFDGDIYKFDAQGRLHAVLPPYVIPDEAAAILLGLAVKRAADQQAQAPAPAAKPQPKPARPVTLGDLLLGLHRAGAHSGPASGGDRAQPCLSCQGRGRKEIPIYSGGIGSAGVNIIECSACGGTGRR